MRTNAVRLYGSRDLRLETFDLPEPGLDELLVKIVSDSLCMSSHKAAELGGAHKRVPDHVAETPVIIGHEFCGEILSVGDKWKNKYKPGQRFSIQPAMPGTYDAAGYTFPNLGGNSQYGIVPACYMEHDNILIYNGDAYFHGSLAEPLSCVIGATHSNYHTASGSYVHKMGIKPGGSMAILAGAGPMGLALIDYILHRDHPEGKPSLLVVTDIDGDRLRRAEQLLPPEKALAQGIRLIYLNTAAMESPVSALTEISGGKGFDDVFVFAPVAGVVEQGDALLAYDGCLNFFAGPLDTGFSAKFNFYNVHYNSSHITGTSGGNTDDMREALALASSGAINPAILVTHIGGLDAVAEATLKLPAIPGGKKLIYNHISLPLTAISDFESLGKDNPLFKNLAKLCGPSGLWNVEAERYLLENAAAYR